MKKSIKNLEVKSIKNINTLKGGDGGRAGGKGQDDIYTFQAPPVLFP